MSKAWKVLGRLAENKVQKRRQELQQINQAIQQLEFRKAQILLLMSENRSRLESKKQGCSMSEIQVITRFITNLGGALRGTDQEIEIFTQKKVLASKELHLATREEQKMDSLLERDVMRQEKAAQLAEQKQLDAAGIAIFNKNIKTNK